jgi:hypothetical protein
MFVQLRGNSNPISKDGGVEIKIIDVDVDAVLLVGHTS